MKRDWPRRHAVEQH